MNTFIADITNELQSVYAKLNERYYENKLPDVIISIQASPRNKYYGWFWKNRWHKNSNKNFILLDIDKDRLDEWDNDDDVFVHMHEINISAEYLDRKVEDIVGTLNHEMVHLYCEMSGIKDTSNNSVYHNKRFKQEAEKRGLIIEYAKVIGWSKTSISEELREFISTIDIKTSAFNLCRNKVSNNRVANRISTPKTTKYVCPQCESVVRGKFGMKLICGNCNEEMFPNKK